MCCGLVKVIVEVAKFAKGTRHKLGLTNITGEWLMGCHDSAEDGGSKLVRTIREITDVKTREDYIDGSSAISCSEQIPI